MNGDGKCHIGDDKETGDVILRVFGGSWSTWRSTKMKLFFLKRKGFNMDDAVTLKNNRSMYQLGGCGKTFVEGFGLVALEVLAWWLWIKGPAGTGKTLDRRTSR